MSVVVAAGMVLAFFALFRAMQLVDRGREVLRISKDALALMRDGTISDLEKETRIQKYSLRLLVLLVLIVAGSITSLGFPVLVVWVLGAFALVDYEAVLEVVESVEFLVTASVGTVLLFWWFDGRGRRQK